MEKEKVNKPQRVICKSVARRHIFDAVARLRPGCAHKWTRISDSVYDYLDNACDSLIDNLVKQHPSVGKTITMGNTGD